jgi:hypothetical protein
MKKVIFGTALASMALLSACSSDNELANAGTTANNAIGFHVVGNKAETRANIINTTTDLEKTDFNVVAFKNNGGTDGEVFMGDKEHENGLKGVIINHKNGKWDYADASDLHYWPKEGSLNFYAVSPATIPEDLTLYHWTIEKATKTITYSCFDEYNRTDGKENPDVMYAIATNQTQSIQAGKVNLNFQHILSQVVFKAKTVNSDMEVDIKEIKIKNFRVGGTFTIPTDGSSPSQKSWSREEVYKLSPFTVIKKSDADAIKIKGTEATDISSKTPMLFVPQPLTGWDVKHKLADADTNGESYLIINCKIKQKNDYLHGTETDYENLYVPFGTSWEPGKCYIYTLIFGGGYDKDGHSILQPINFEATAEAWTNVAGSNINI